MVYFCVYLTIGVILSQLSFIEHKKITNERLWYKHYWSIMLIYTLTWISIAPLVLIVKKGVSRDLFYWSVGLLTFILAFYK
jgi:hypothetical protein